ncbi:MAG: Carbon monoxide dehydrogenase medium chain [Pseudomonadota bacterium]
MIPPRFEYHAPKTIAEAIGLLTSLGSEAKLLAGGHSLLPMMKLRFAQPEHLIDINRIPELRGIRMEGDELVIGAMTSENELIQSALVQQHLPLLSEAAKLIADPQVRNRGTIGGDIAHGDPGNDHPALSMAIEANFVLQGPNGRRTVPASEFFFGTYMTALGEHEVLVEIRAKPFASGTGYAYEKLKRKTGDWATAACAAIVRIQGGVVSHARITLTNLAPTALRAHAAEEALIGQTITASTLTSVADAAMAICDPAEDLRGDPEYKTAMAGAMVKRAIQKAASRCA